MNEILNGIAANPGAVTAVATVVIAFSAVFTAIVTRMLARENRLLRKAGTEPKVVAYLTPELGRHVPLINLNVANIGQGPAQNVVYSIDAEENDFEEYNVLFLKHNAQPMIAFLPQGERIRAILGTDELLGDSGTGNAPFKPPLPPFNVTVRYENLEGKSYKDTHLLDVSHFANMGGPAVAPEHEIAEALKEIEQHVRKLSRHRNPHSASNLTAVVRQRPPDG